jgi:hypothetical protein
MKIIYKASIFENVTQRIFNIFLLKLLNSNLKLTLIMKENKNSGLSRRKFIGNTAKAAAVLTVVPGHVVSGFGFTAPSDKLNVACVGIGGMGASNLDALKSENMLHYAMLIGNSARVFEQYPEAKNIGIAVMYDRNERFYRCCSCCNS